MDGPKPASEAPLRVGAERHSAEIRGRPSLHLRRPPAQDPCIRDFLTFRAKQKSLCAGVFPLLAIKAGPLRLGKTKGL